MEDPMKLLRTESSSMSNYNMPIIRSGNFSFFPLSHALHRYGYKESLGKTFSELGRENLYYNYKGNLRFIA